jgi:hypothetical protein
MDDGIHALGKFSKALEIHQQALAVWKTIYNEDSEQIATCLNKIGFTLNSIGIIQ